MKHVRHVTISLLALGFCLSAAGSEPAPERMLRFCVAEGGVTYPVMFHVRALRLEYWTGRFRVGVAYAELYNILLYEVAGAVAPVHIGYSFYSRPRKTAFFYGMVPEARAEVTFGLDPDDWELLFRAALVGEVDRYGVGLAVEVGYLTAKFRDIYVSRERPRVHQVYVGARVRALAFGLRL